MVTKPLEIGISPCPNDVFIFGTWIEGLLPKGFELRGSFVFSDVEDLNRAAEQGRFEVVKVSAVQGLRLQKGYRILATGAAFGSAEGPKLIVPKGGMRRPGKIAVPGLHTTAALLLRAAADWEYEAVPVRYDRVVEKVADGTVSGGLLIHETALAPERYGVEKILDLGKWWGENFKAPLPLGVIVASKALQQQRVDQIESHIRESLARAWSDPEPIMPLVRSMAQELDESVIQKHIDAYVSPLSMDMGETGRRGLEILQTLLPQANRNEAP